MLVRFLGLLCFEGLEELLLISMGEVEDEGCAILEFYQQTLPKSEVPPLDDIDYLDQGPVLLDWLVVCQHKRGKLQMRVLLKGGDIPEPT